MNPNGAIIVQSNLEIMVEVDNPNYTTARDAIAPFTELVKSPEHLHTYKISHLSLWNAAATGLRAPEVLERLESQSRYPIPPTVVTEIEDYMARYGLLRLKKEDGRLTMESDDKLMFLEICKLKDVEPFIIEYIDDTHVVVDPERRGHLKMVLTKDAAQVFYASGSEKGGSGVIVLPCGSGKTVIGLATMALVQTKTLILTPNISSSRQWIREICDKTNLTLDQVKEYSGEVKEIGPVTVATYQILTQRKRAKKGDENKEGKEPEMTEEEVKKELANFPLFSQEKWGLMIYDEVHLLPAPVFRLSTEMQATRRLGLTATLVREDHKETEVFSLIGPKKFDIPWRILEAQGWIATADCNEIRIPMDPELKMKYALAPVRDKITLASTNPEKTDIVERLLKYFSKPDDRVLIIGQYIDQLEALSEDLQIPLITGKTPNKEREKLYGAFRSGAQKNLMVSKVGNFAIDLPDANVLIQISGTFGSRQEEAQRLGRVLRPKSDGGAAHFYSIVTQDSKEQEFAMNRQLFLTEQGYAYKIIKRGDWDILMRSPEELAARA